MNLPEQIYSDLKAQIPALMEALKTGTEYASELGSRIATFHIIESSIYVFLNLLFLLVILKISKFIRNRILSEDWDEVCYVIVFVLALVAVSLILGASDYISDIVQWAVIPEIQLIKFISNLTL